MSVRPRLLPWPGTEGKRCYLVADEDGDGPLSRLGDELGHVGAMVDERRVRVRELRFLVKCLCEALRDALRVAESRGGRLGVGE